LTDTVAVFTVWAFFDRVLLTENRVLFIEYKDLLIDFQFRAWLGFGDENATGEWVVLRMVESHRIRMNRGTDA